MIILSIIKCFLIQDENGSAILGIMLTFMVNIKLWLTFKDITEVPFTSRISWCLYSITLAPLVNVFISPVLIFDEYIKSIRNKCCLNSNVYIDNMNCYDDQWMLSGHIITNDLNIEIDNNV